MTKVMSKASDPKYRIVIEKDPFSLKIIRKESDAVM